MRSRPLTSLLIAVAVTAALAACGSSADSSASTSSTTATTAAAGATSTTAGAPASGTSVSIKNFAFTPNDIKAKVGDTITVSNNDTTVHTMTALDKSFDTGNIDVGKSATITLAKPGTFQFHCSIHTFMTGSVSVS
jgi:plastocyanin